MHRSVGHKALASSNPSAPPYPETHFLMHSSAKGKGVLCKYELVCACVHVSVSVRLCEIRHWLSHSLFRMLLQIFLYRQKRIKVLYSAPPHRVPTPTSNDCLRKHLSRPQSCSRHAGKRSVCSSSLDSSSLPRRRCHHNHHRHCPSLLPPF